MEAAKRANVRIVPWAAPGRSRLAGGGRRSADPALAGTARAVTATACCRSSCSLISPPAGRSSRPPSPDTAELLTHGENAWLVPPDRPDAAAAALDRLLGEPGLAAGFSPRSAAPRGELPGIAAPSGSPASSKHGSRAGARASRQPHSKTEPDEPDRRRRPGAERRRHVTDLARDGQHAVSDKIEQPAAARVKQGRPPAPARGAGTQRQREQQHHDRRERLRRPSGGGGSRTPRLPRLTGAAWASERRAVVGRQRRRRREEGGHVRGPKRRRPGPRRRRAPSSRPKSSRGLDPGQRPAARLRRPRFRRASRSASRPQKRGEDRTPSSRLRPSERGRRGRSRRRSGTIAPALRRPGPGRSRPTRRRAAPGSPAPPARRAAMTRAASSSGTGKAIASTRYCENPRRGSRPFPGRGRTARRPPSRRPARRSGSPDGASAAPQQGIMEDVGRPMPRSANSSPARPGRPAAATMMAMRRAASTCRALQAR